MLGYQLLERLQNRELLVPYLEQGLANNKWPDKYNIEVDSSPYKGSKDGHFHPSSHVFASEKFLYLALHPKWKHEGVYQRRTLQGSMTLAMGSALHAVVQTQLNMIGMIEEDDIEVPILDEERKIKGHMDFRVHHPNHNLYAVDLKTQNSRGYDMQKTAKDVWLGQLRIYMKILGIDKGIVLVLESGFPYRMKEFHLEQDEDFIKVTYDKWAKVLSMIENDDMPEGPCHTPGTVFSDRCPFRHISCGLEKYK